MRVPELPRGGWGAAPLPRGPTYEPLELAVAPPPGGLPRSFVGLASGACVAFKRRERETLLQLAPRPWLRRTLTPGLSEAARFRCRLPGL